MALPWMKDMLALRWRIGSLLFAVLVIVALPYLIARNANLQAQQAGVWVTHSMEVKALTYRIAYDVRDSEAALYRMLAGNQSPVVARRVQRASQDVGGLIAQLRASTRDNPNQQVQIGALESVIGGRLGLMAQAGMRYQQGNVDGARAAMDDSGTLFEMDGLIQKIVQSEDDLLKSRVDVAERDARNSRLVLSIAAVAQLLLLGIIVVVSERQIGQRRRAEAREGVAVARSQLIVQAVREPIALLDDKLQTLLVNAAFSELYGTQQQERALSRPLAETGEGAWSDKALLQRLNDVLLRDRELWDYELRQRTVDGVDRHVLINARRLHYQQDGSPVLLLTVSDVTARTLIEQQVTELNRQLQGKMEQISDVNRELEAFSYSVSHDLRAPLRHIAGFAGKLSQHLGEQADEKTHHYLEVIATSSRRMAQLIDDLLVFSRLGRGALRLRSVDMQSLVEEARELAEMDAGGRELEWRISPLPVVIGDENMLRTVWQNLLSNAVKYTGQCEVGRIEVGSQRGRDGDYEFTVADNGAGFDMQYAGKLFGVFQRLHRASEFPGNGIGLANVRRIIARHGGRVWAEAEPGQGARFHFSLPAHERAESISRDPA